MLGVLNKELHVLCGLKKKAKQNIKSKDQIQKYLSVRIVEFVQIILDHLEQTNTEVRVICAWFLCLDINSGIFFFFKINKSRNTHKQCHSFHTHWAIMLVEKTKRQTIPAGWNIKFSTMKDLLLLPGSEGERGSDGEVDQEGIPAVIYAHAHGAFRAIKAILPPEAPGRFLWWFHRDCREWILTASRGYYALIVCIVVPLSRTEV